MFISFGTKWTCVVRIYSLYAVGLMMLGCFGTMNRINCKRLLAFDSIVIKFPFNFQIFGSLFFFWLKPCFLLFSIFSICFWRCHVRCSYLILFPKRFNLFDVLERNAFAFTIGVASWKFSNKFPYNLMGLTFSDVDKSA